MLSKENKTQALSSDGLQLLEANKISEVAAAVGKQHFVRKKEKQPDWEQGRSTHGALLGAGTDQGPHDILLPTTQ